MDNFNLFFDDLGADYKSFRKVCPKVYNLFRCGLAHEYFVKKQCMITMPGTGDSAGIRQLPDGRYEILVEQYYNDLKRAFEQLEQHLYGSKAC